MENPTISRPFWSVMIPTYNPKLDYLRETVDSVLQQAPDPSKMQIEVVDDCSPTVEVEPMVQKLGGGRIAFSRTSKNLGLAGCWNECIARARGEWVHILHQDDYVLPGFYKKLEEVAAQHPEVSLVATRSFYVDENSFIDGYTRRLLELENGGRDVKAFYHDTPIQCPGVAIRRGFYQKHGGFRADLLFVIDREMWSRAIGAGGGVVVPQVLSSYRKYNHSQTGRLIRSGESLRDMEHLNHIFAELYDDFDAPKAAAMLWESALGQAEDLVRLGDMEGAENNWRFFRERASFWRRARWFAGKIKRGFRRRRV